MSLEDSSEFGEHGDVPWVSGVQHVRGREQPTFQTVKVKALTMLEASQPKPNAIELADDFLGNLPVVDLLVIRRVFAQEILIGLGERRGDARSFQAKTTQPRAFRMQKILLSLSDQTNETPVRRSRSQRSVPATL